jgi:outer membrane biosynthesis protein TonB
MTFTPEHARFMGVAIATAMNELDVSLTLPSAEGVIRPNPESKTPRKQKAKPEASAPKKTEPKAPVKRKTSSKKKKDPLAPRKSKKSASPKPKRRTPEENSKIVHVVNGYIGMASKASTQAGARIWLLKATKATPKGWTKTHEQILRHHVKNCPDIAA